jgi:hypothetical protein
MWCDASPSVVKIAELANPYVLSSQQYGRTAREDAVCSLVQQVRGQNTVKSSATPMFQQK